MDLKDEAEQIDFVGRHRGISLNTGAGELPRHSLSPCRLLDNNVAKEVVEHICGSIFMLISYCIKVHHI